jgi:serine/threonine protein kinase/tetratricopeptide (TPR) repeat protein
MADTEGQSGTLGGSVGVGVASLIGRVVDDFEIIREVGRGGMGTVYEARQRSLNRKVALKALRVAGELTQTSIERFRREAQAAGRLRHNNIVGVYAQGESDGLYYYAMEFVEGRSLIEIINELRGGALASGSDVTTTAPPRGESVASSETILAPESTGTLTTLPVALSETTQEAFDSIARHLSAVADGLAYAHRAGVIHRDIKPHNFVLGNDGVMKVTDFGLARVMEQPGVTMTGEFLGSPLYMSPEQINGAPSDVDHRTDIYSLGATMYEWLTLSPPFPGETRAQVISRIMTSDVVPPRQHNPLIPVDLETICMKALEKEASRRYASSDALADDLRNYLKRRTINARREGRVSRWWRLAMRHRVGVAAALALVMGVIVTFSVQSSRFDQERIAKEERLEQAEQEQDALQSRVDALEAERTDFMDALQESAPVQWEMLTQGAGAVSDVLRSAMTTIQQPADGGVSSSDGPTGLTLTPAVNEYTEEDRRLVGLLMDELTRVLRREVDRQSRVSGRRDPAYVTATEYFRQALRSSDPKRALDLVNESFGSGHFETDAWQLRAILLLRQSEFAAALEDVSYLIQFNPDAPGAYLLRGMIRMLTEGGRSGIDDLNRAIELAPRVAAYYAARAFAFARVGEFTRAFDDLDRASQLEPAHQAAEFERLRMRDRVREAIAALSTVVEKAEDPFDLLVRRGDLHAMCEAYDEAVEDYSKAIKLRRVPPADLLARLTYAQRERDMARRSRSDRGASGEGSPEEGALNIPDWVRTLIR